MTRQRALEGPTISLFPFLAVLLCMMGALLVLLVLFSRSVKNADHAEASAAVEQLQLARDSLAWRVEQLGGVRDRTSADLAKARLQLAGIEEHTREMSDELNQVVRTCETIAAGGGRPTDSAELATLEERLKSSRESLDKTRAELATKPPAYAVVPYVGTNGTHRRPLYIECCGDGVFLQPEGIRLSPSDFEGPPGPGNPLASALRAAREQITKSGVSTGDPAVQPYPLLLVRPSGVMAYYAAREAIQSWGTEFGYQLIDEDWTLSFTPRDATLAEVETQAIVESRRRLAWLAEVRPAKPSRPSRQYRAATTRGGVIADGGPSVLGDQSRWNWSNQEAADGGPGGGGQGGGSTTHSGAGADGGDGGPGRPLVAGGSGASDEAGTGDAILGGTGNRGGLSGSSAGSSGSGGGSGPAHGQNGPGPGGPSIHDGEAGGQREPFEPTVSQVGGSDGSTEGSAEGRYGGTSKFQTAATGNGSAAAGIGSSAGGSSAGGSSAGGTSAGGSSAGGTSAGGSSAGADQKPGGSGGGGTGPSMPGLMQSGGSSSVQSGSSEGASMAQARGKNWASLATQDRPIPLTRPIRLECTLNEFRILDDGGRRVETRIHLGSDTAEAIDPLVKAIHHRVAEWGLAGERMYWKPQLILSATPDGQSRREDLERLLADSGLETKSGGQDNAIRNLPPIQRTSSLRIKPDAK